MLIKLNVENFKSFDDNTELTMICSSKIQSHDEHLVKVKSTNILRHAVIYGANASGKTNLVEFFRFFKDTVQNGLSVESMNMFCKNKEHNKEKESTFELQIAIDNKFYAYGFSAILSRRVITKEWLYELYQNGNSRLLFERECTKKPTLGDDVKLNAIEKNKFNIYSDDFSGNETSLFLTEMNRGKKINQSKLMFFNTIYNWIDNNILIITPNTPLMDFEYYYNEESLSRINELIKTFDTGINKVNIEEITLDELASSMPKHLFENVMDHFKRRESIPLKVTMRSNMNFFSIETNGNEEPKVSTIKLHHNKSFFDFNFNEESDGTRRIFDLMDMLLNKREDVLYVVDELERSLHPKLTEHFLKLFMHIHENQRMQLLFTTHESSIMEQSLFRRDEIWFIERNANNESSIYSLDTFKERYDKVLSKAYLEGRYGAIPVFSSFNFNEDV